MTTTQELFSYEQAALASFAAAAEQAEDSELHREVARLEGRLEQLHSVAVVMARRTEQIEEAAAVWSAMVQICEHSIARLRELAAAHPDAVVSYDKVLDLLSDCRERHAFHA